MSIIGRPDTFSPKAFKKDLNALYDKTLEWMNSSHVYTVRYGIVTQLQHFLDVEFRKEMLDIMADSYRRILHKYGHCVVL